MPRVLVAMSGGVDSSVAAALLKQEQYEVIGATMQFQPCGGGDDPDSFQGCCGFGAISDAQQVASILGIPHYVLDFGTVFAEKVIADFCAEYRRGRTPNPCIRCNEHIKFGAFLVRAAELGADFIATGHHARIEPSGSQFILRKGEDVSKDQSYALYVMTQEQLERTLMPIGSLTKDRVREIARRLSLPVAAKPESQEICFVPDNDYRAFIERQVPDAGKPGPILNLQGELVGRHHGIIEYTIGQRRGLGIAAREPYYVIRIDADSNAVVVGSKDEVWARELSATQMNWIMPTERGRSFRAEAKMRYRHEQAPARITPLPEDRCQIQFDEPQWAITPGQAVVLYRGDRVIGGGTIETAGHPV